MMKRLLNSQFNLFAVCVFLSVLYLGGASKLDVHAQTSLSLQDYKDVLNYTAEYQDYGEYQAQHPDSARPQDVYEIEGGYYVRYEGKEDLQVLTDYRLFV